MIFHRTHAWHSEDNPLNQDSRGSGYGDGWAFAGSKRSEGGGCGFHEGTGDKSARDDNWRSPTGVPQLYLLAQVLGDDP